MPNPYSPAKPPNQPSSSSAKWVGTTTTVCTDNHCPIHDPNTAARKAETLHPSCHPHPPTETQEEAEQRQQEHEQLRNEHEEEQQRRAEEFRQQEEQRQQEYEAEQTHRNELRKAREATFERILENAPTTFTAAELRIVLRAIVNLDPYTFADDLAADIATDNEQRGTDELLLAIIESIEDEKLTRFALKLALSGHVGIPGEHEFDFLAEAEIVFAPPQPKKKSKPAKVPTPIKAPKAKSKKAPAAKTQVAA